MIVASLVALIGCLVMSGCTPRWYLERPTLDALRPAEASMPGLDELIEKHRSQGRFLIVERFEVPRGGAEAAWSMVDESVVPPEQRRRLSANGLRVGLLPMEQTPRWTAALGRVERVGRFGYAPPRDGDVRHAVVEAPRPRGSTLRWSIPNKEQAAAADAPSEASGAELRETMTVAGPDERTRRMQYLLHWPRSSGFGVDGPTAIRLLPRQVGSEPSAIRASLGFTEPPVSDVAALAVDVAVPPEAWIVIGATPDTLPDEAPDRAQPDEAASDRSAPDEPTSNEADSEGTDPADASAIETSPVEPTDAATSPVPRARAVRRIDVGWRPLPDPATLGQLWFKGRVHGQPGEAVLLVAVWRIDTPPEDVPLDPGPGAADATGASLREATASPQAPASKSP